MIKIKIIDDKDYNRLLELYQDYQEVLPTKHSNFVSARLLNKELLQSNSIALGLYKEDNLVGFILGEGSNKVVVNFSSMYVDTKHRYYVKKFLQETERYIKSLGYSGWIANSVTKQSGKMFNSYGAVPIEIKYYKEI